LRETYRKRPSTAGAREAVGAAEAGVDDADVSDDECFMPPTTPPTIAAAMMTARRAIKSIQKVRLRKPQILRGVGSGGRGISSSIIFDFAGVIGVSGTMVVPAIAEVIVPVIVPVIVESMAESIDVGDSLPLSSTLISFSVRYISLLSRGRFS